MSGGESRATIDCDDGTQSISPITKTKTTKATIGIDAETSSKRNEQPISGSPTASFSPAGYASVQRISRIWKKVTKIGLITTRKPHVEGEIPCEVVSEIGRTVSYATYTSHASEAEKRKTRNGRSRTIAF